MGNDLAAYAAVVRSAAIALTGGEGDHDHLLDLIGERRLVLLGESSHGTHEYYRERARITRRLIEDKGFDAIAVEADWPDAHRVNRFVRGGSDATAREALGDFERFPRWMWRNREVLELIEWLRERNAARPPDDRAGFYGLDLYSLRSSAAEVVRYLERVNPGAARDAREHYACFEPFGEELEYYGLLAGDETCEDEALAQLEALRRLGAGAPASELRDDARFDAEQNARLVANAEAYYRAAMRGGVSSWNVRDRHMAGALDALLAHLSRPGRPARIVVWAHNSHLGDARASRMGRAGELNLGQLARERHPDDTFILGFSTHEGTVTAANSWGGPPELKTVRPSRPGGTERLLHDVGLPAFVLPTRGTPEVEQLMSVPRLERAIGVIYRPETELQSHYFEATAARRFDAILHVDRTTALEPLDGFGAERLERQRTG